MSLKPVLGLVLVLLCLGAEARPFGMPEENRLLAAEEAFRLLPVARDGQLLRLEWAISPGYYLYRDRLTFEVISPRGFRLPPPALPAGEAAQDAERGTVQVFRELLDVRFVLPPGLRTPVTLRVHYQGCADAGVCYPPQSQILTIPPARS